MNNTKTIENLRKIIQNVGREICELEEYSAKVKNLYMLVEDHSYLEWDINTNLSGQHIISTKNGDTILNIFLEIGEEDKFACMIGSEFKLLSIDELEEFIENI